MATIRRRYRTSTLAVATTAHLIVATETIRRQNGDQVHNGGGAGLTLDAMCAAILLAHDAEEAWELWGGGGGVSVRHRIAIVGCGAMAARHEEAVLAMPERVQVVATVDPELPKARRLAENLGGARYGASVEEFIGDIDAAIVVTPHDSHHDLGMLLLSAGKHVLMEKPLALSEGECLALIHQARRSGRVLMTAHPMRFHPLVQQAKRLMDDGALGTVFQMSIWTEQYHLRADAPWMSRVATLGGGQLFSHGCHYIDLLLWFLGRPVCGSHHGTRRTTEWLEGEGTSNVVLEFESGALGYHMGTWGARGTKLGYNIQVHGSKGMAEVDYLDGEVRIYTEERVETVLHAERRGKYIENELAHFLDCIESGAEPLTSAGSALQGLRVIWRLYAASAQGTVADLAGLGLGDDWDHPGMAVLPSPA
ncbi:Gfo/Idh/MocA family protein [Phytoactinopolyspora limicola]|uniref:Gfo/Idh/MocA family protein n=1 Tax=Phytoactinopolyspora limicola TaxID=2715536 RepID=UPI00140C50E3|nr:Gfo/Idh/MocA family oxidoreductase [Phytoactinopolyspora limicola]